MTHGMRTTARTNAPHQRLSFPVVMMMLSITISATDTVSHSPSIQTKVCPPSLFQLPSPANTARTIIKDAHNLPPHRQGGHVDIMMMMFTTISARDYRSKGRRRKGAFVRRVT